MLSDRANFVKNYYSSPLFFSRRRDCFIVVNLTYVINSHLSFSVACMEIFLFLSSRVCDIII